MDVNYMDIPIDVAGEAAGVVAELLQAPAISWG